MRLRLVSYRTLASPSSFSPERNNESLYDDVEAYAVATAGAGDAASGAPGAFSSARRNATSVLMWARIAPTTTLQLLFFEKFSKLAGISAT